MRIGIDISQIVHEGTGVAKYVEKLVQALLTLDRANEYILFGASLRKRFVFEKFFKTVRALNKKAGLVTVPLPPTVLDWLWNRLHIIPIERFIGKVDVFWSSDWTQPPLSGALGITTIHDVSFLKFPESFAKKIIEIQKRRLGWAKKTCQVFLCDSEATRRDANKLLGIDESRLRVVYPGFN